MYNNKKIVLKPVEAPIVGSKTELKHPDASKKSVHIVSKNKFIIENKKEEGLV